MLLAAIFAGINLVLIATVLVGVGIARGRRRITVLEAVAIVVVALFIPCLGALGGLVWLTVAARRPLQQPAPPPLRH